MEITKRDGRKEGFELDKIANAIRKALVSTGESFSEKLPKELAEKVTKRIKKDDILSVEHIQDVVEETLMANGEFQAAKNFILFRQQRRVLRHEREEISSHFPLYSINKTLDSIQRDFPEPNYSLSILKNKFLSFSKSSMGEEDESTALIRAAVELTDSENPKWEFIAARILDFFFKERLKSTFDKMGISTYPEKVEYLVNEGLYGEYMKEAYSRSDLEAAYSFIDEERDKIFTYSGLDLLLKRYVLHSKRHEALESPQEMYLAIALHLAIPEKKEKRLEFAKELYDVLSLQKLTMATPTMANSRKPLHQLSSCFVDTVPDSLDGIYRSLDNFAKVSKYGGGMGLYLGKIRANGSAIRGFEGAAGGVIRWIKLINDTAVAVDQLGVRAGAVAVYLDVWHKDLLEFLNLRTNNGDDRMKAHDVFPAICYPDYFWELCKENLNQSWYLMCPYEIRKIKGYSLEDYFGDEWKKKYLECVQDNRISKREILLKDLIRLILKSAVETGTPFTFNRDAVNEANPNKHLGNIYSSNLCTEIAQNMSPIELKEIDIKSEEGDPIVVTTTIPGSLVVCNLASLTLGHLNTNDDEEIERTVRVAVRALDNVIDLNYYPVAYAEINNKKYRAIGLGASGYHHMLSKNKIKWESEEHLKYVDELFEKINYYAIDESRRLAIEKGKVSTFDGSEWDTGVYFDRRGYNDEKWTELKKRVHEDGMRNSYLLAIAPTSSTSIISGTTAGVDPVMKKFFYEEKKGSMLPRVAPELSMDTWWYYKSAYDIDQSWSIRAEAIRQRHIDQAQSMNLYITNDYSMRQILDLYILAWEKRVKTIYYIRSKSLEVEECESCSS